MHTESHVINETDLHTINSITNEFSPIFEDDLNIANILSSNDNDLIPSKEEINHKMYKNSGLSAHQMQQMQSLLEKHIDVFTKRIGRLKNFQYEF